MNLAGKDLKEYTAVIKKPVTIIVVLGIIVAILALMVAFSSYIPVVGGILAALGSIIQLLASIGVGLVGLILGVYVGYAMVKKSASTLVNAVIAGGLLGIITGLVSAALSIVQVFTGMIGIVGITGAIIAAVVGGIFMLIIGPIVGAIVGVILGAIGGVIGGMGGKG